MQAAILSLYDPDRSQTVMNRGAISGWDDFLRALRRALQGQEATQGAGVRILTEMVASPSLHRQLQDFLKRYPKAKWHQYEPTARANAMAGSRLAFGEVLETQIHLEKAEVILSLDADVLGSGPGHLRHARAFAQGRDLAEGRRRMNRLYVVEPGPSITGSAADHRLPLRAGDIENFARRLANALGVDGGNAPLPGGSEARRWIDAVANDLKAHRGRGVILAGDGQPPVVHALAHAMNAALANAGETVLYTESVFSSLQDPAPSLKELVDDMNAKRVDLLVILGGNPVYDAPADLDFQKALDHVALRVRLAPYEDETSNLCHWHIPQAHPLESWGDGRASDGTVTIAQPLIEPLYGGKTPNELLSALGEESPRSGHDVIKDYWKNLRGGLAFESFWKTTIHDGVLAGSAFPTRRPALKGGWEREAAPQRSGLELVFKPDPTILDGRWANNGWLQELPKPLTKLTWDNAALLAPVTALKLGLANEDVVELSSQGRTMKAPVWITPGHAEDSVTVYLGYGRTQAGNVGTGRGVNAYALRTAGAMQIAGGLTVRRTSERRRLACTQLHHSLEGRDIVRGATLDEYVRDPRFAYKEKDFPKPDETLYAGPKMDDAVGWGMTIDMNLCTGCNACIMGCQAENNIPVVGREQVLLGREMQWIRVDNYFQGGPDNPEVTHQPVPCMHCEDAPCEPVCPVGATVHSDEGLNEMVYNRCIGTRYCSNNCPYKVRRFNFFQYADTKTESLKFMRNPDVTVRERGVMEKCTYCVQRINVAKIASEKENRPIRDGEIVTACQAACASRAITFGNVKDPGSAVSRRKAEPRNYAMLGELGVRPRTTYLAKVRNVNPALA
jgi:molybdopterin-containing oxidoreductase family iron-sulfur binding subunit